MKKVGILSIGDELMNGFTIDTNSSWISQKVSYYESLIVKSKVTVCDDEPSIHEYLKYYIDNNYDYIFITGGLGPTHDDITKNAIASFFNLKLVVKNKYYSELLEYFTSKYGDGDFSHLKSQAKIINSSIPIKNKYGTANKIYKTTVNFFILIE